MKTLWRVSIIRVSIIAAALMLLGCCNKGGGPLSEQGVVTTSFREPPRKTDGREGMIYDHETERMIVYPIPKHALAESATLLKGDPQQILLDVVLKDPLPSSPTGWLTIEAHFSPGSPNDDPPTLVYLSARKPIPDFPYLIPNGAVVITSSGRMVKEISVSVRNQTVRFIVDASLIQNRDLFAVVLRFLPDHLTEERVYKNLSGGFNAGWTDFLRDDYMPSIMVPNLPQPPRVRN